MDSLDFSRKSRWAPPRFNSVGAETASGAAFYTPQVHPSPRVTRTCRGPPHLQRARRRRERRTCRGEKKEKHSTSMEGRKNRRGMKRRERKRRGMKTGREEQHHPVADPTLEPNPLSPVRKMEAKNSFLSAYGPAPWLVFSHGKRERTKTFFNVSEGSYHVKNVPEMRRTDCLASYYGWLVMVDKTCGHLFLLNSVSLQKIQLPYLSQRRSFERCVLSSPPTDPDCVIIFVGCSPDFLIYCHPGSDKWIKRKYRIGEADASIWKLVSCNGKVYTNGSENGSTKLGIIDVNADPPITWLEPKLPEWPPMVVSLEDFLVESCGEIFLVRRSHLLSIPRVSAVDVHKMDFDSMAWVKVDTLGDRVLFLGENCSTSCSATDSGIERDCIYFTKPGDRSMYVFHLDRGTISIDLPCPNVCTPWAEPFWVMPTVDDKITLSLRC